MKYGSVNGSKRIDGPMNGFGMRPKTAGRTVRTVLQTVDGREKLDCGTAHMALQMKKTLDTHADALAQAIKAIGQ